MGQQQRGQSQQPYGEPPYIKQLQATLNAVPAHTWYATAAGGLTFVNKRVADYLGLPNDHPLRLGIDVDAPWDAHIPLLHPDDHEEARQVWSSWLHTGKLGGMSFRVRSAEGDYRWFFSRCEPLWASDGTLLLWVGVNLDIEDLKSTEKALRESEARFRDYAAIGDADWYWETDPDHKFARVTDNGRLLARRGFALAGRIGLTRWDVATDIKSEPDKWELHRSTLKARQPFRDFVYRAKRSNGSLAVFKVSGNPIYDAKGAFLGYRGTGTDLTEVTRAQEEHERLLRLKSDLANELEVTQALLARASQAATVAELSASIAHEINQPLAGIVANAQACQTWLSGDNPNLPRARAAIERIIRDAHAAADIVRRIRALFKQTPPAKTSLHINEAVDEVSRLAQDELRRRGVSMELDLAQSLPVLLADRIQIQQVLMNLIRNGAEAMDRANSDEKRLIVRSRLADRCIVLEVCDSGPGLLHPDKAFEPFYSTKQDGLGVGLAISRSIVQAHGGVLRVRDNQPQGATFWLTLPLFPEAQDDARI